MRSRLSVVMVMSNWFFTNSWMSFFLIVRCGWLVNCRKASGGVVDRRECRRDVLDRLNLILSISALDPVFIQIQGKLTRLGPLTST